MSTDNIDILCNTAIETLERFAFLLGDPPNRDEAGLPPLPPRLWLVTLTFTGARTGTVVLATAPDLARQIAANLYSLDLTAITDDQAIDALKELLNVTTGDYLHALEGNEPIFDLTPPALAALDRAEFERHWADRPHIALNVEGQPLWLGFGS